MFSTIKLDREGHWIGIGNRHIFVGCRFMRCDFAYIRSLNLVQAHKFHIFLGEMVPTPAYFYDAISYIYDSPNENTKIVIHLCGYQKEKVEWVFDVLDPILTTIGGRMGDGRLSIVYEQDKVVFTIPSRNSVKDRIVVDISEDNFINAYIPLASCYHDYCSFANMLREEVIKWFKSFKGFNPAPDVSTDDGIWESVKDMNRDYRTIRELTIPIPKRPVIKPFGKKEGVDIHAFILK